MRAKLEMLSSYNIDERHKRQNKDNSKPFENRKNSIDFYFVPSLKPFHSQIDWMKKYTKIHF